MPFDKIIGQNRVKKFFSKALQNDRLSHAYLFVGDRGVGKEALAIELAKALFCTNSISCDQRECADCARVEKLSHPDLHFIFPAPAKMKEDEYRQVIESVIENPYTRVELWANPSISIGQIRELRKKAAFKSFEGKGRIVIMADCERMTIEASNSLLKILEEPPEKMKLLMTSSRPNLLLPTITSRCQEIKFDPLSHDEIEQALITHNQVDENKAALLARLSGGSYWRATELLDENLQQMQELALEFFRKSVQNQFIQIQYVETILNKWQRDSKKIKELLTLLALWLRDAQVFRETNGEAEQHLIHFEKKDVLGNFVSKFPNADLHSAVNAVEESLQLINRNVQINLILIVLLNKLRNFLRG